MQAVQIKKYGDRDTLEIVEVERPVPGPNQVLIEIHSASVNPIDWKLRSGKMKLLYPLSLPAIMGFDLAGVVTAVGGNVKKFKIGDDVYSRSNKKSGESYAEWIALDEDVVALKPEAMSYDEAAAVPLAALTALQALRDQGKLKAGQRVLINGASGGVGMYAVQIARAMDAHVVATCSGANVDFVKSLGAQEVIDYKTSDPLAATEPYDMIFDAVASFNFGNAKKSLKAGGRLIATSPNGSTLFAMFCGNVFSSRKAGLILVKSNGADLEYLGQLVQQGRLKSTIDSTFRLDQIQNAHERSETSRARGKVVIKIK